MNFLYAYKQITQHTLLATETYKRQWNDAYSIILTVEGKSELLINDKTVMLYPGTATFCNRDCYLQFNVMAEHDLIVYIISFHILQLVQAEPTESITYEPFKQYWREDGPIYGVSYYRFIEVAKELLELRYSTDQQIAFTQQTLLYELLPSIHQQKSNLASPHSTHHGDTIQQVITYMHHHYQDELTRDGMAKFTGFHPRFFSKIFKLETGMGFSEYMANIRIDKTKEQLLLTDLNLNEIAANVGYSNGLYLSRKFKQVTGISPKGYMDKPKRMIIYDWIGNLLALGIKPIGASYFYGLQGLYLLKDMLEDVVDVGRSSVESIIELDPELIIAPKWLGNSLLNKLTKIAPTIIVPYGNSFERFRSLAHTLKREQEAEQFINKYKQQALKVKQNIQSIIHPNETVGLYELAPSRNIWVMNELHGRGGYNLYEGLALSAPDLIKKKIIGKDSPLELPLDQLPLYAADHMIISYPFDAESKDYVNEMMNHPVWKSLSAYQSNKIYFIDKRIFHANDVYSLYKQLELQEHLFLSHSRNPMQPCHFVHEISDL